MPITLTANEKCVLLNEHIFYEIIFALGVSNHDSHDYCVWEHLNFSRMGHARALIWFFENRKWPDDIVSEDFGFPLEKIQLSTSDRNRLNKDLYHLTSARLHHDSKSKPWPNTFLNRIHERAVKFIRYLLSTKLQSGIKVFKPQWEALLFILESGHELLISSPSGSEWILSKGKRIDSGLSELTVCFKK